MVYLVYIRPPARGRSAGAALGSCGSTARAYYNNSTTNVLRIVTIVIQLLLLLIIIIMRLLPLLIIMLMIRDIVLRGPGQHGEAGPHAVGPT